MGILTRIGVALLIAAPSLSVSAGETEPPGPPASTPGPEPRTAVNDVNTPGDSDSLHRITQPGSYYLTGDITGEPGKHGIEIIASDVTLDLNGFTLRGVPGSLHGIRSTASNEAIRNGSVVQWGDDGISLGIASWLEGIRAANNGRYGLLIGDRSRVAGCVAIGNGSTGILAGDQAVIVECVASANGTGSFGFREGIEVDDESIIVNCVAEGNDLTGIACGFGGVVEGSVAIDNGSVGISAGSHSVVTGSTARRNNRGITARENAVVRGCTASENVFTGILVVSGRCLIENNVCSENATGIAADGIHNRIDGNHAVENGIGIHITGERNFVLRNTAGGNTGSGSPSASYDFDASFTSHGPIIFTGDEITTTNPWANFEYVSPL